MNATNFKKLPKREQELYRLYKIENRPQKEIAEIMHVTQGAISHRLHRVSERLLFLDTIDAIKEKEGIVDLEGCLKKDFDPFETEMLKALLKTTCQSETAIILNDMFNLIGPRRMNQVKVKYRFFKCLKKMKKRNSVCYSLFDMISKNLYKLHEIPHPHFYRGLYENRIS